MGYDIASDPLLAPAIDQAIASGTVVASLPTTFLGHGQSIVLFKALYQGRYVPQTADEPAGAPVWGHCAGAAGTLCR